MIFSFLFNARVIFKNQSVQKHFDPKRAKIGEMLLFAYFLFHNLMRLSNKKITEFKLRRKIIVYLFIYFLLHSSYIIYHNTCYTFFDQLRKVQNI